MLGCSRRARLRRRSPRSSRKCSQSRPRSSTVGPCALDSRCAYHCTRSRSCSYSPKLDRPLADREGWRHTGRCWADTARSNRRKLPDNRPRQRRRVLLGIDRRLGMDPLLSADTRRRRQPGLGRTRSCRSPSKPCLQQRSFSRNNGPDRRCPAGTRRLSSIDPPRRGTRQAVGHCSPFPACSRCDSSQWSACPTCTCAGHLPHIRLRSPRIERTRYPCCCRRRQGRRVPSNTGGYLAPCQRTLRTRNRPLARRSFPRSTRSPRSPDHRHTERWGADW